MTAISEDTLHTLAGFKGEGAPVTTCYLDVDGRRLLTQRDIDHELDGVLRTHYPLLHARSQRQVQPEIPEKNRQLQSLPKLLPEVQQVVAHRLLLQSRHYHQN